MKLRLLVPCLALGATLVLAREEKRLLRAAPVVGYGGATAARIWVAPADPGPVTIAYASSAARGTASGAGIVNLDGLTPDTDYEYDVRIGEKSAARGTFRTGPLPGKPVRATIALASCMNVRHYPSQVAWDAMAELRPRLLVHLGDNIYANSTRPHVIRDWYLDQRSVPQYARLLGKLSTLAIWDDHDFGANDSDGSLEGKEESLATFRELWPNPASGLPDVPGVFHEVTFGDVDLFLLDTRYHRSSNWAPDDGNKTMLGAAQWRWLEEGLRASRATFKLVASGSTLEGSFKDYWGLYPRELARLYALTRDVSGMVFLTGDVHRSVVMKSQNENAGYPIYEVVSSGIAVEEGPFSFVALEVDTTIDEPRITCRIVKVSRDGAVIERAKRTIKAAELRVAD